jgi:hypothetical protein
MNSLPVESALTEVWEWREQLRLECEGMSAEEEADYLHSEVEKLLQIHGFKQVPVGNGRSKLQRLNSAVLN